MATVNVYLTFNGNCKEAFDFYKSVFGGDFPFVGRFGDMPSGDENPIADEDKDRIMHINLPISKETILMGSDTTREWAADYKQGNNFSISVNAESRTEADHIFSGLSAGGMVTMPMENTFWGAYFGMFVDQFGISWMINYDDPAKMQHQ
ncbi:VOC family protein [Sphingobacterium sp. BIGb0165]|uniref:VOC family protein n=1 Tax=Sphingobacterium sp. BIGb0165 TaxID=2940615 RepID=UPI002166D2A5|nr:VOC family protein [Sphingobacterium sp. BIGb0165]MCS4226304.1 PhnB protein [Sphingobacterium sp. BIGb0165]